eukprot:SAG22_NODE_6643_length_828_cov_0.951989_1_plen_250_part_10
MAAPAVARTGTFGTDNPLAAEAATAAASPAGAGGQLADAADDREPAGGPKEDGDGTLVPAPAVPKHFRFIVDAVLARPLAVPVLVAVGWIFIAGDWLPRVGQPEYQNNASLLEWMHHGGKTVAVLFMTLATPSFCRATRTGGHLDQLGAGGGVMIDRRSVNWLRCVMIAVTVLMLPMTLILVEENVERFLILAGAREQDDDEPKMPLALWPIFFLIFVQWYYTMYFACVLTTKHVNNAITAVGRTPPGDE